MSRINFSKPQQGITAAALRLAHHAAVRAAAPPDPAGRLLFSQYSEASLPKDFLAPPEEVFDESSIFLGGKGEWGTQKLSQQGPMAAETAPGGSAARPF